MIFKKIRKGHADWINFLCSTPAMDYVFQKIQYDNLDNRWCFVMYRNFAASD